MQTSAVLENHGLEAATTRKIGGFIISSYEREFRSDQVLLSGLFTERSFKTLRRCVHQKVSREGGNQLPKSCPRWLGWNAAHNPGMVSQRAAALAL